MRLLVRRSRLYACPGLLSERIRRSGPLKLPAPRLAGCFAGRERKSWAGERVGPRVRCGVRRDQRRARSRLRDCRWEMPGVQAGGGTARSTRLRCLLGHSTLRASTRRRPHLLLPCAVYPPGRAAGPERAETAVHETSGLLDKLPDSGAPATKSRSCFVRSNLLERLSTHDLLQRGGLLIS